MKQGWLWLSILKTHGLAVADIDHAGVLARPLDHPRRPVVGSFFSQTREDL